MLGGWDLESNSYSLGSVSRDRAEQRSLEQKGRKEKAPKGRDSLA